MFQTAYQFSALLRPSVENFPLRDPANDLHFFAVVNHIYGDSQLTAKTQKLAKDRDQPIKTFQYDLSTLCCRSIATLAVTTVNDVIELQNPHVIERGGK